MQKLITKLFARFGCKGKLNGQPQLFIFQTGHSRSLQSLERIFTPLGEIPRGQYVCYFPADVCLKPQDTLDFMGRSFAIYRAEPVFLGRQTVYIWALCAERGGESLCT